MSTASALLVVKPIQGEEFPEIPDAANTSFLQRKRNIFSMVSQRQKTWFVELGFDYTPSYT